MTESYQPHEAHEQQEAHKQPEVHETQDPHESHEEDADDASLAATKLQLIVSPVIVEKRQGSFPQLADGSPDPESLGGYRFTCPEFHKHEASTNLELFYDLWFVAVLEVFTTAHEVTDASNLESYVGYLSLLWFTWILTGLFDVRFVTDSIFERLARTAHLGVMVGFAVVASQFDPSDQIKQAFQAMSIILMVSRLVLVVQYSTVLWHIRHYKEGKISLAINTAFHFVAAMIYLGITFRFTDGKNSRVFIAWYVVSLSEVAITLGLGLYSKVLSFKGTHLSERMTLLTLIVLGEGVVVVAENVVVIVTNNGWTSATIGVLTAGIAIVYFSFMIYFDWMGGHHHLTGFRQVVWVLMHFPYHISLILYIEGATQFITWWKIIEMQNYAYDEFTQAFDALSYDNGTITSSMVASHVNATVNDIWKIYQPTYTSTLTEVDSILKRVLSIPDSFWNSNDPDPTTVDNIGYWVDDLLYTVLNSIFVNFKIDQLGETSGSGDDLQWNAIELTNERYFLVFQYTFATAGFVLILMTILAAICKRKRWTAFNYFRTAVFLLMGIGLALIPLISTSDTLAPKYLQSPWLLPTLCLVFFLVQVMTHLPHPPPLFFKKRANRFPRGPPKNGYSHLKGPAYVQGFSFVDGRNNEYSNTYGQDAHLLSPWSPPQGSQFSSPPAQWGQNPLNSPPEQWHYGQAAYMQSPPAQWTQSQGAQPSLQYVSWSGGDTGPAYHNVPHHNV